MDPASAATAKAVEMGIKLLVVGLLAFIIWRFADEAIVNIKTKLNIASVTDNLASDVNVPRNKATQTAANKLTDATEKLTYYTEMSDTAWGPFKWYYNSKQKKANATVSAAKDRYELAKSNDSIFQSALGNMRESNLNKVFGYLKWVIIAAVVIIVLLLIFKMLSRPRVMRSGGNFGMPRFGRHMRERSIGRRAGAGAMAGAALGASSKFIADKAHAGIEKHRENKRNMALQEQNAVEIEDNKELIAEAKRQGFDIADFGGNYTVFLEAIIKCAPPSLAEREFLPGMTPEAMAHRVILHRQQKAEAEADDIIENGIDTSIPKANASSTADAYFEMQDAQVATAKASKSNAKKSGAKKSARSGNVPTMAELYENVGSSNITSSEKKR